jgi:hypothetical protein
MIIGQFSIEFTKRHDFAYEDINYLPNKYYHIAFKDIPEAWVCPIDLCLEKMEEPVKVSGISQHCGFAIIYCDNVSDSDRKLLNNLENTLRLLDLDLHEQLKDSIELH